MERAKRVVVRTLSSVFYIAGERWEDDETDRRQWPPSADERYALDAAYSEAIAAAQAEQRMRQAYEYERLNWLIAKASLASDEPLFAGTIELPDEGGTVQFEEFSTDGRICGARTLGSESFAFGGTAHVLAVVSGRGANDPWVVAVTEALGHEQALDAPYRRRSLKVIAGEGEFFHASEVVNRWSIAKQGLDWRHMGAGRGIAGSTRPEAEAVVLCESLSEVKFFTDMCPRPTDVWAANVEGTWVENGTSGWWVVRAPIPPSRVRLVLSDVWSERHHPDQ